MSELLRKLLTWFVNWLLGEDALRDKIRDRLLAIEAETATAIAEVRQSVASGLEALTADTTSATAAVREHVSSQLQEFLGERTAAINKAHVAVLEKLETNVKRYLKQAENDGHGHRDMQEWIQLHMDRSLNRSDEHKGVHARRLPPE